tara:strand:- start:808 stop:1230 length:423 start_codon:yes stop_codon:yes gene_type:complete
MPSLFQVAVRMTAKKVLAKWTAYLVAIAKQGGTVDVKILNKFDKLYGIAFADDADLTKKPVVNAMADIHTLMGDISLYTTDVQLMKIGKKQLQTRLSTNASPQKWEQTRQIIADLDRVADMSVANEDLGIDCYQADTVLS